MRPVKTIDDPRYVKAMSHPLRVRILAMLGERRASPRELAQLLSTTLGTTAYHVRMLERLGLIELVDERPVRGAIEHYYRALCRPRVSDEAWAQASPIAKQTAVGSTLQVIDEYARLSAAAGGFDRADAHLTRRLLRLDSRGFEQLSKACARLLKQAQKIEADAEARMSGEPHADGVLEVGLAVLLFEAVRLTAGQDCADDHTTALRAEPSSSG